MKDVTDGKYVGDLTPEETIEQYEYRILIHESYAGLVVQNPSQYPPRIYGSYEYNMWAINGYEWGIKYIRERNPIRYVCTNSEAISTIIRMIFRR